MSTQKSLTVNAYAKVNLTLEVLGRRPDGYHEIASVMQTVGLHDVVELTPADDVTLECDRPGLETPDNLALKAAAGLRAEAGVRTGVHIKLRKAIPASAGLGGGSSDAAATLVGLNRLWGLGMSAGDLTPLATALGSDVPFFLRGGTAMVQGRGERVRPLPGINLEWMLIVTPAIEVPNKTATLYSALPRSGYTAGHLTRKLEARIRGGGDVPRQLLFNAFDDVAEQAYPGIREYLDSLYALGAREVHLAGSGPSLYTPVSRREQGTAIQLVLRHRHGWESHLVSPWQPEAGAR